MKNVTATLYCFPLLLEDEPLYSACARYADRMSFPAKQTAIFRIYGGSKFTATFEMSGCIDNFISSLPPGFNYSSDYIIKKHTFFPYYKHFMKKESATGLRNALKSPSALRGMSFRTSLSWETVLRPQFLRFCPDCVESDRKIHGFTYWRRLHQLSGVFICCKHNTYLEDTEVAIINSSNQSFYSAEINIKNVKSRYIDSSSKNYHLYSMLARDSLWLLEDDNYDMNCNTIFARYISALIDLDYISPKGSTNFEKVIRDFIEMYGDEFLSKINCSLSVTSYNTWIHNMINNTSRTHHPLKHILFARFLKKSISEIFASNSEKLCFGPGPWKCRNIFCPNYKLNISTITQYELTFSGSNSTMEGTFTCNECGYSYVLRGPNVSPNDPSNRAYVREYGHIWKERFIEAWNNEFASRSKIEKEFKICFRAAKRYALSIGLDTLRTGKLTNKSFAHNIHTDFTNYYQTLESDRKTLSDTLEEKPNSILKEGMILHYSDVKHDEKLLMNLTNLTSEEFMVLVEPFEQAFQKRMEDWTMTGKRRIRHRKFSIYRNCQLPKAEDRLLFVLSYLKHIPNQAYHGATFGMIMSRVSTWLNMLIPVLKTALQDVNLTHARARQELQARIGEAAESHLTPETDVNKKVAGVAGRKTTL